MECAQELPEEQTGIERRNQRCSETGINKKKHTCWRKIKSNRYTDAYLKRNTQIKARDIATDRHRQIERQTNVQICMYTKRQIDVQTYKTKLTLLKEVRQQEGGTIKQN